MDDDFPVLKAVLVLVVFVAGICLGTVIANRDYRNEAVKVGTADWIADENGRTEFRWRDCGASDEALP